MQREKVLRHGVQIHRRIQAIIQRRLASGLKQPGEMLPHLAIIPMPRVNSQLLGAMAHGQAVILPIPVGILTAEV